MDAGTDFCPGVKPQLASFAFNRRPSARRCCAGEDAASLWVKGAEASAHPWRSTWTNTVWLCATSSESTKAREVGFSVYAGVWSGPVKLGQERREYGGNGGRLASKTPIL